MNWVSVLDSLPEETQAYGCTTDDVHVRNSNSGFEGVAFLARTTIGPRWFDSKYELMGITHWRYKCQPSTI